VARVRARRGRVVVDLTGVEVQLLAGLGESLAPLLDGGPTSGVSTDPVRDRLFPRAYLDPTEEHAEGEWQSLVHPELVAQKSAALATLAANLADAGAEGVASEQSVRAKLTASDAEAWIMALNDARVVLGVTLEITDSFDPRTLDPTDPTQAPFFVYDMLTHLQGALVEAVSG